MNELVPDNSNRFAYLLGQVFHPFLVMIITLWLILDEFSLQESLAWILIISAILLIPIIITIALLKMRERYTYQRGSRLPLYLIAWLSVLLAIGVSYLLNSPQILLVCLITLALWLPVQLAINHFFTKISSHLAVISGCFTALVYLQELRGVVWISAGLIVILLTAWARLETKNHSLLQVVLGFMVGSGMVLLVFPVLLA